MPLNLICLLTLSQKARPILILYLAPTKAYLKRVPHKASTMQIGTPFLEPFRPARETTRQANRT